MIMIQNTSMGCVRGHAHPYKQTYKQHIKQHKHAYTLKQTLITHKTTNIISQKQTYNTITLTLKHAHLQRKNAHTNILVFTKCDSISLKNQ